MYFCFYLFFWTRSRLYFCDFLNSCGHGYFQWTRLIRYSSYSVKYPLSICEYLTNNKLNFLVTTMLKVRVMTALVVVKSWTSQVTTFNVAHAKRARISKICACTSPFSRFWNLIHNHKKKRETLRSYSDQSFLARFRIWVNTLAHFCKMAGMTSRRAVQYLWRKHVQELHSTFGNLVTYLRAWMGSCLHAWEFCRNVPWLHFWISWHKNDTRQCRLATIQFVSARKTHCVTLLTLPHIFPVKRMRPPVYFSMMQPSSQAWN